MLRAAPSARPYFDALREAHRRGGPAAPLDAVTAEDRAHLLRHALSGAGVDSGSEAFSLEGTLAALADVIKLLMDSR